MMPLTENCPKPLLKVRGRSLIEWNILNLVKAGMTELVINHAYLGSMIEAALGDGSRFGARITYSPEGSALGTAGAVAQARHLLGEDPFVAVSADIYCPHFDFRQCEGVLVDQDLWGNPLPEHQRDVAWLFMVKNPWHNPNGDFAVNLTGLSNQGEPRHTFANIGVYRPAMFDGVRPGDYAELGPMLRHYADLGQLGGELIQCSWENVGTPEQLAELNAPPRHGRHTLT